MKRKYVAPKIAIIDFENKDIITESKMQWDSGNDQDNDDYGKLNG